MFDIKEAYGIKGEEKVDDFQAGIYEKKILLIPELLNDIIRKILHKRFDSDCLPDRFINGYSSYRFKGKQYYMSKRGKIRKLPKNVNIYNHFYEDLAWVDFSGQLGVLNGITGKITTFPNMKIGYKFLYFFEGLAPISIIENENEYMAYLSLENGVVSTEHYKWVSYFRNGKAIVQGEDGKWKFINKNFKTILSLKDAPTEVCQKMAEAYNNIAADMKEDPIEIEYDGISQFRCLDMEANLPLTLYTIMDYVCEELAITLKSQDPNEQLVEFLDKVSKKGTYLYDLETCSLKKVEVARGVQIKDPTSREWQVSFDTADYDLLRSRIKK